VAQKIQTLFIDDLDGSEAEGTVRFGLDGAEYEIDLNTKHADALRAVLSQYVAAARRSAGARKPARSGRRASGNTLNSTEVRDWARSQGIEVKDRGRVPAELIVKFKAATGELDTAENWSPERSRPVAAVDNDVDNGAGPDGAGIRRPHDSPRGRRASNTRTRRAIWLSAQVRGWLQDRTDRGRRWNRRKTAG
jgi:Lsr2